MSFGDWIGVISLMLVIPLGIASNLLTPRLLAYLERRKLVNSNRTKMQELKAYRVVQAFKEGVRDKYAHYIVLATAAIFFELAAATLTLIATVNFPVDTSVFMMDGPRLVFGFVTGASFMLGIVLLLGISNTERRLNHFDEYTAEVRQKWGAGVV